MIRSRADAGAERAVQTRFIPSSGYGFRNPAFNGLAIYHVLEGSSMAQDPPVLKLEPAEGHIVPRVPLDPGDFPYPENGAMLRPLITGVMLCEPV